MFENEVIIKIEDKNKILEHIKEINKVLDKYPFELHYGNTQTVMSRAKITAKETEEWISYLYTKK